MCENEKLKKDLSLWKFFGNVVLFWVSLQVFWSLNQKRDNWFSKGKAKNSDFYNDGYTYVNRKPLWTIQNCFQKFSFVLSGLVLQVMHSILRYTITPFFSRRLCNITENPDNCST